MKYGEWLEKWYESYVVPSVKAKTATCYKSLIDNHIVKKLGDCKIGEITPILIQQLAVELMNKNGKNGKGLSANTVNMIITLIQGSLKTASALGYIKRYSLSNVKRPKTEEKQITCFSIREQKRIEQAVYEDGREKMFGIIICLYTGLRIGELLALEWSDVDFKSKELAVTKSCYDSKGGDGRYARITCTPKTRSSIRNVPIPKQLLTLLREKKQGCVGTYVVSDCGNTVSVRSYQRSFELLLKKLKIRHRSFHALRHTFATRALECGMDVKTLAEILGHKNPTVTLKRYAHSLTKHKHDMMNRVGKLL